LNPPPFRRANHSFSSSPSTSILIKDQTEPRKNEHENERPVIRTNRPITRQQERRTDSKFRVELRNELWRRRGATGGGTGDGMNPIPGWVGLAGRFISRPLVECPRGCVYSRTCHRLVGCDPGPSMEGLILVGREVLLYSSMLGVAKKKQHVRYKELKLNYVLFETVKLNYINTPSISNYKSL
jgi:hypothetical protein